jgi:RimJ/RimL family protein N-acetyltransferase
MIPAVLSSQRLVLDAFGPDDTDLVHTYVDDAELQRCIPVPVPYTRVHAEHYTGKYAAEAAISPALGLWAIRENGALVGALELRHEEIGSGDLGYWIGAPHRGRGVMTEAIGMLATHCFAVMGLERLSWQAVAGNAASAIPVQRNGFVFEGTRRRGLELRDQRVDSWVASLLHTDPREPASGWPL